MTRVYWSLLIGLAILVAGVFFGFTGLLLLPIIGVFVIIAIFFWLAARKAENEPPAE